MKSKYTITLKDGTTKEIFLKKHGKKYIAYDGKNEFDPVETGTLVEFNGNQKVVPENLIYFDINGLKILTYFNNWAAPKLTVEKGVKVKSNFVANNLKIGLPLLLGFVIAMVVMIILLM